MLYNCNGKSFSTLEQAQPQSPFAVKKMNRRLVRASIKMHAERLDMGIEAYSKDLHTWIDGTLLKGAVEWRSGPRRKLQFFGTGSKCLNQQLRDKQLAIHSLRKIRDFCTYFLDASDLSKDHCDPVKMYLRFYCAVTLYPTANMGIF